LSEEFAQPHASKKIATRAVQPDGSSKVIIPFFEKRYEVVWGLLGDFAFGGDPFATASTSGASQSKLHRSGGLCASGGGEAQE
jgi:hypothetical protein